MIEQGTKAGVFEKTESELVESVLRLDDQSVNSLMTPRPFIVWLDVDASLGNTDHESMTFRSHQDSIASVFNVRATHRLGVVSHAAIAASVSSLVQKCPMPLFGW